MSLKKCLYKFNLKNESYILILVENESLLNEIRNYDIPVNKFSILGKELFLLSAIIYFSYFVLNLLFDTQLVYFLISAFFSVVFFIQGAGLGSKFQKTYCSSYNYTGLVLAVVALIFSWSSFSSIPSDENEKFVVQITQAVVSSSENHLAKANELCSSLVQRDMASKWAACSNFYGSLRSKKYNNLVAAVAWNKYASSVTENEKLKKTLEYQLKIYNYRLKQNRRVAFKE